MLNENEIDEIYHKFVEINYTHEYANKYVPLPTQYNDKNWRWEGKDFPRIISLLEFREYMLEYDRTFDDVLSFNGFDDPEYEYLKFKNSYNYNYTDDKINYDLHNLNIEKKDFDFAMFNQTIEHLYDPIVAIKNIYKHMKIGGMFYANVPANNIPHGTPQHFYTGITPMGLGAMVKLAGFDILKIGQWGNLPYYKQAFDNRWSDYQHMGSITDNPGHNDLGCPLITWCLAIKNK